ncbi:terminal deoxynucleotidyl [Colletotrichum chrysophilum]|uniref:Terminal deoxynucleotidyl n=1 Tax=Colletotrichum chrysophilum TaxID=1836956 RepID=A0AAD9AS69_9PEZI|nr:terminal deoxynucleotidyl [Colletotrichum chrysophilum]
MATDLAFPLIFLLPTHLDAVRLHELEENIPSLTYDIQEAEVILGNISKRQRALFELRQRKLQTVPVEAATESQPPGSSRKRKRDEGSSDSDSSAYTEDGHRNGSAAWPIPQTLLKSLEVDIVRVVKLNWLTESLDQGRVLPLRDFVIYEGRKCGESNTLVAVKGNDILARAAADTTLQDHQPVFRRAEESASASASQRTTMPSLLRQTTSEHDLTITLAPIPDFLRTTYACQRATPADPANAAFIEELKAIRTTRKLIGDQIGVRAYSTSIATLSAYPCNISSPQEVARLPGCGTKVAELWHEWKDAGRLHEASEAQADPKLSVLRTFYDIWGVGDATARDFYKKGGLPKF